MEARFDRKRVKWLPPMPLACGHCGEPLALYQPAYLHQNFAFVAGGGTPREVTTFLCTDCDRLFWEAEQREADAVGAFAAAGYPGWDAEEPDPDFPAPTVPPTAA